MKKRILLTGVVLVLIAGAIMMYFISMRNTKTISNEELNQQIEITKIEEKPSEKLLDFKELWKINKEIIAYISIPDTDIKYPVLFSENNSFYLTHNISKEENSSGELFIETYNSDDFKDKVTIIYGHNMPDGSYFGHLQEHYCDSGWFKNHPKINLFLPDRNEKYTVKAAVPFSALHIMYYYDFDQQWVFDNFIEEIYSTRSMNSNFSDSEKPTGNKPVLILSTCLDEDRTQRYLVIAEKE